MSEDNDLLNILDGNVAEVKAALDGLTDDELNELLAAEEAGKTRVTVIEAITERLAHAMPTRADELAAEIDRIEAGVLDIKAAERLQALRAELADLDDK